MYLEVLPSLRCSSGSQLHWTQVSRPPLSIPGCEACGRIPKSKGVCGSEYSDSETEKKDITFSASLKRLIMRFHTECASGSRYHLLLPELDRINFRRLLPAAKPRRGFSLTEGTNSETADIYEFGASLSINFLFSKSYFYFLKFHPDCNGVCCTFKLLISIRMQSLI